MEGQTKMIVKLISHTEEPEKLCGMAAACCYDSDDYESALRHSAGAGHTSVLEHASFTFLVDGISRACLAQLTRHRMASYSVQSQRYVRLDGCELVIPETIRKLENADLRDRAIQSMMDAMKIYAELVDFGVPAEDARYITPQSVPTRLFLTMNARELLHFFSLRTCNRAQWEIRDMAKKMLILCRDVSPEIFGKAGPGCLTGKCPEKRPCGHPQKIEDLE